MLNFTKTKLLLYPCTVVGYVRLFLIGAALLGQLSLTDRVEAQWVQVGFGVLISLSLLLDLLDGHLARKFGHVTDFGKLFDLLIDLATHTLVWVASGFLLAPVFIGLEWIAGLCIAVFAMQPQIHWKRVLVDNGPALIKTYFANNQRNALSAYGNVGHFLFPLVLYVELLPGWLAYLALPGLLLYEAVTGYMLYILLNLLIKNGGQ